MRRWSLFAVTLLVALLAACTARVQDAATPGSGASSSSPTTPTVPSIPTPSLPPAPSGMWVRAAQGLYLLDTPLAGEPAVDGSVEVRLGADPPPADTTVTLNGVPLQPRALPGLPRVFWAVDPSGPQPAPATDGSLTVEAHGGGAARTLVLPCPADVAVASTPPVGGSLASSATLTLGWAAPLPANVVNVLPSDFYPSALLRGLDVASSTASAEAASLRVVPRQATSVALDVGVTALSGWVAELSWPGQFVVNGTSAGFCGRVKRLVYAR
jgi:hypothetical protein